MANNPDFDKGARKPEPRQFEQVREWQHGSGRYKDRECPWKDKLIHTPVGKIPTECRRCPNDEWVSKGIVTRDKETKEIIPPRIGGVI